MPATSRSKDVAKLAKGDAILGVAIRVFAEHGFAETDVQVIADEAGVGKGTVYRHFGKKEELFLAAADAGMKQLETFVIRAIGGCEDDIELIRGAGLAYAEFFQKRPELVEILIQERAAFRDAIPPTHLVYRQKNRPIFEDAFRRAIDDGVIRNINVRDATSAFANLLYGTVVCGCLEGSTRRLRRMAKDAIDIFLNGVLVEPRKKA
jgi:AcrR family transcriptional regulator